MAVQVNEREASYHYAFPPSVPIGEVGETLTLAVMATESLHGRARVHLDASFVFDESSRMCVIDASTDVGRDLSRIFTGYLTRTFGEQSFSVERRTDRVEKRS